jgi:hypothetical protein
MEVLRSINRTQGFENHGEEWDVGFFYELLECLSCRKVVLLRTFVHPGRDPEGIEGPFDVLYPAGTDTPSGLPKRVENSYDAALAIRRIDPNAFAVLLGRVLDTVCEDRQAKPDKLFNRIEDLAERGEFPPNLKELAHNLRKLRNVGAHASRGIQAEDAPLLESLCRALLLYVYTAPALGGLLSINAAAEVAQHTVAQPVRSTHASRRAPLALPRQALCQEYLEQRLIRHIALVRQHLEILDHGHGEPQRYCLERRFEMYEFRTFSR